MIQPEWTVVSNGRREWCALDCHQKAFLSSVALKFFFQNIHRIFLLKVFLELRIYCKTVGVKLLMTSILILTINGDKTDKRTVQSTAPITVSSFSVKLCDYYRNVIFVVLNWFTEKYPLNWPTSPSNEILSSTRTTSYSMTLYFFKKYFSVITNVLHRAEGYIEEMFII